MTIMKLNYTEIAEKVLAKYNAQKKEGKKPKFRALIYAEFTAIGVTHRGVTFTFDWFFKKINQKCHEIQPPKSNWSRAKKKTKDFIQRFSDPADPRGHKPGEGWKKLGFDQPPSLFNH